MEQQCHSVGWGGSSNAPVRCQKVRHRERGGAVLHQKTLRDTSRFDEAKRSIWHNYCTHTLIDEHMAWEDFLDPDCLTLTSQFQPNRTGSIRPINSKCFYLPAIRLIIGIGGHLYLIFRLSRCNTRQQSALKSLTIEGDSTVSTPFLFTIKQVELCCCV